MSLFYIKIYVPFLYELCVLNGNSAIFLYKLMGQRQFIFVHIDSVKIKNIIYTSTTFHPIFRFSHKLPFRRASR